MNYNRNTKSVSIHIFASGRVQGVGFRYYVNIQAKQLGVTGFVRNTHDGRLEVLAEGSRSDLESLEQAIQTGPELAFVTEVDVRWTPPTYRYAGFYIQA